MTTSKMLQVIGHRGFKAKYPENTLLCYEKAYEAGSEVIETDLQLTKDGKIVMNHDINTERVWDQNVVIGETNLDELLLLKSKINPEIRITTFKDALLWLKEHPTVKFMLDIKPTNDKVLLIKAILEMREVVDDLDFWRQRLMFGLWQLDWYKCGVTTATLKGFKIVAILPFTAMATKFVEYSKSLSDDNYKLHGVSLHFINSWKPDFKKTVLPYFQENNLAVYLWTVNSEIDIKYISSMTITGIIVDDPVASVSIRDDYIRKAVPFVPPIFNSSEGFRLYLRLRVFEVAERILSSRWATVPVFHDITLLKVTVLLLRRIHFI
ncbi:Pgc1 [Kluyveromyces lactis]|nr:Pgc1 [Kluyveromyces lactis]